MPTQSNVLGVQLPQSLVAIDPTLGFLPVQQPTAEAMKGAVAMDFREGEGKPSVNLKAGGKFLLTYAPERSPVKATVHGMPAYGVDAYVRFEPSGKVVRQAAVAFEQTQSRTLEKAYAVPVLVEIPPRTTKVSVWFKQFSAGDAPADVRWDSNLDGQNYNYTLE